MILGFAPAGKTWGVPCHDPIGVIKAFYDSTDSLRTDKSLSFFAPNAEVTTWAEGVNGRHWQERHYRGPDQIGTALSGRGFRRISENPESPVFHETEFKTSPHELKFMLRPDRLGANNRPYNPYQVVVTFKDCLIKSMTVIEFISWE
jgi:hypothetical protein